MKYLCLLVIITNANISIRYPDTLIDTVVNKYKENDVKASFYYFGNSRASTVL